MGCGIDEMGEFGAQEDGQGDVWMIWSIVVLANDVGHGASQSPRGRS